MTPSPNNSMALVYGFSEAYVVSARQRLEKRIRDRDTDESIRNAASDKLLPLNVLQEVAAWAEEQAKADAMYQSPAEIVRAVATARGAALAITPIGVQMRSRPQAERLNEEVYQSIPALNHLSVAAMQVSNKLTQEARNALFFPKMQDPELRTLKVEVSLVQRDAMLNAQPDLEWFNGMKPAKREEFWSGNLHEDEWLKPE